LSATYAGDVAAICDAERRSGISVHDDTARVTQWIRGHLTTRQGRELFASLRDAPVGVRAHLLRAQARAARSSACPLAESYDALSADDINRRDLQRLCSIITFPDLPNFDPLTRLQVVSEWLLTRGTAPIVHSLAIAASGISTPRDFAALLRNAAGESDVVTCDVARQIEAPQSLSCPAL
jgi:hypothetical protein